MPGLCGPLASWSDMKDGTYELVDVCQMHAVLDEMIYQREQADNG